MTRTKLPKALPPPQSTDLQAQQNGIKLFGVSAGVLAGATTAVAVALPFFGLTTAAVLATSFVGGATGVGFAKVCTTITNSGPSWIGTTAENFSRFVNDKIASGAVGYEQSKRTERDSKLLDAGIESGYYWQAGGVIAGACVLGAVTVGSFALAVPVTAAAIPYALAMTTVRQATKDAIAKTTIGDDLEITGAKIVASREIFAQATTLSLAAQTAGLGLFSLPLAVAQTTTEIAGVWYGGKIEALVNKGKTPRQALERVVANSSIIKIGASLKIGIISALVCGVALLSFATFGAAGGIAAAAFVTPAFVGMISLGIGAIAGAWTYYRRVKRASTKQPPQITHSRNQEMIPEIPEHTQTLSHSLQTAAQVIGRDGLKETTSQAPKATPDSLTINNQGNKSHVARHQAKKARSTASTKRDIGSAG